MGRKPKNPGAIPRLRERKKPSGVVHYYYDHGGKPRKETPLGSDYGLAIKRWAELEGDRDAPRVRQAITFRYVVDRYRVQVLPTKAPGTQKGNLKELKKLLEFFDDPPCPLESIKPLHVHQFMAWRKAKVRANREKALLSHIWNFAREQGYTDLANPCAGIKGFKETGRDKYVHDDEYKALWDAACAPLRDAMDLAYLTGQRPGDVLRMDERHLRTGVLEVRQAKTAEKRRIEVMGEFSALLDRIAARKRGMVVRSTRLLVDESGKPLTTWGLRRRFNEARAAAGVSLQFRDFRAKAATDKADSSGDIRQAQQQLGHSTLAMTEHYVKKRLGQKVTPTK